MTSTTTLALALLALSSPALGQADDDTRLRRASQLLAAPSEGQVRQGARLCLEVNSAAAVELLLGVLNEVDRRSRRHLPPGHYRDVVWEVMPEFTDPYARERVAVELLKNRKNPFVRQWCAELLGIYRDAKFAGTLIKALKRKGVGVKRAAARSLGMLGVPELANSLRSLAHSSDPYLRANAIESMMRLDADKWAAMYEKAVREDSDGRVRCALLGAAPAVLPDKTESLSQVALGDDDWRPRMQAVDNFAAIKTKTSIDSLIVALGDERPAVAQRAQSSLQSLTGQPIRQTSAWQAWWHEHRATFAFPEGKGKAVKIAGNTVIYNSIPLTSDHVAFLLDRSYMMGEQLESKNATKEEAALTELARVLGSLEDGVAFNVHTYNEEVHTLSKNPDTLGKKSVKRVITFVRRQEVGRAKDIWQVLEQAISDSTLDTMYLLSSGEPDIGLYVHWNRITRYLADLNRFHKVTVHAIAYSDNQWYRDQLEKIAECTGGQFAWFR